MRKTAQQPSQSSSAYTFIISVCSHPRALITDETMPKLTIQERNFVVHTRGDGHVYGTIVAKLEGRWTKVSKTTVGKLCWRFEATGLVAYRVHETADSFGIAHQENTEFAWVCEGHSQSFAGPRNRYFLCDLRSLGKSCEVAFYANIIIIRNFAIICGPQSQRIGEKKNYEYKLQITSLKHISNKKGIGPKSHFPRPHIRENQQSKLYQENLQTPHSWHFHKTGHGI